MTIPTSCVGASVRRLACTAIALLVATAHGYADPDPIRYRERTGASVAYLAATEQTAGANLVLPSRSTAGEEHTVVVDPLLAAVSWTHRDPVRQIDYQAVRDGSSITLAGHVHGDEVQESFTLRDSAPWIQSIERSLQEFVLSEDRRIEFWTIQPGDFQLRKLQAVRRGRATVTVNGVPTDAWEIRLSLPGVASLFWSATYWFRTTDGLFVRSEAVRGWPGTPVTVVELVSE